MWKQYLIGALVSVGAAYLFLRTVPIAEMGEILSSMDLIYFLPASLIYLFSFFARSMRWHYLLRPVARVAVYPLFKAMLIGFLGNNLLPAHLGELVRAYIVGKENGVSKSSVLATIVLERVYDGLTVLLLLLVCLVFMDLPQGAVEGTIITVDTLRTAGWWGLLLFAGIMVVLQAFRWQRDRSIRFTKACLKLAPAKISGPVVDAVCSFSEGLAVARAKDLVWVAVWSVIAWLALATWAWSVFPALGLKMTFMAGILTEVVLSLSLLIPSAPAFLGTWHLAATAILCFMGEKAGVAGGYAMALWLNHFVVTTGVGLIYLWQSKMGFSSLSGAGELEG